jgi:signal transduction histidine kinase
MPEASGRPPADFGDLLRQVRDTGRSLRAGTWQAAGDGRWFDLEVSPVGRVGKKPAYLLACWYEVTELAAARSRAEAASDRLGLAMDMAVALASQLEPAAMIRCLLVMTVTAMGGRATLSRVTGEELVVVDSYSAELPVFPVNTRWRRADYPLMDAALESGVPQTGEENRDPAYFPDDVEIMAVSLHLGGVPFATLGLSRKLIPFSADDRQTLQLVGTVASQALRNADLFEELRETSRTKTQFMNLVAHELRGPLSVISAYLSMLEAGTVKPEPTSLGVLAAKVLESNQLIDRLLLAARLEGGARLAARLDEVDLRGSAEAARERMLPKAVLQGARVNLHLPAGPVLVETDAEQLDRILDNLLQNAITYADLQPIVDVDVSGQGEGETVEVLVRDNGRGIPRDRWENVFQQFTRLEETPGHPGTGLGLYISRRLAEGLGGGLDIVASQAGEGTTFRLWLPRRQQG